MSRLYVYEILTTAPGGNMGDGALIEAPNKPAALAAYFELNPDQRDWALEVTREG